MNTILQDKWGRDVALTQDERGFVYSFGGVQVVRQVRDDARVLDQIGMVDVPVLPQTDAEFNAAILEQIAEIDAKRDADLLGGITVNGVLYHTDEAFRADLTDLIMGYDKGYLSGTQAIRTKINTIQNLGYAQIVELKLLTGLRRQQIFAPTWAAKDVLRAQLR